MRIDSLLMKLSKPAQRALRGEGITTLEQLAEYSEKEVSNLHGIGNNAIGIMKTVLEENGLSFRK